MSASITGLEVEIERDPQIQNQAGFAVFNDVTRQSASGYFPEGTRTFQQCLQVLESFINSHDLSFSAFWPSTALPVLLIDGEGARLLVFGVKCAIRERGGV